MIRGCGQDWLAIPCAIITAEGDEPFAGGDQEFCWDQFGDGNLDGDSPEFLRWFGDDLRGEVGFIEHVLFNAVGAGGTGKRITQVEGHTIGGDVEFEVFRALGMLEEDFEYVAQIPQRIIVLSGGGRKEAELGFRTPRLSQSKGRDVVPIGG